MDKQAGDIQQPKDRLTKPGAYVLAREEVMVAGAKAAATGRRLTLLTSRHRALFQMRAS
jgi:hypothetical protein